MNFLKFLKNTKGQAIVESIIALSVLTVGFLSLIALMSNAIGLSKVNSEYYVATYLAAEGIEVVKNIIDTNVMTSGISWNQYLNDGLYEVEYNTQGNELSNKKITNLNQSKPLSLHSDGNSKIYDYSPGEPTPFRRVIEIRSITTNSNDPINHIKVKSTVFWTSRGGAQFQVDLEDHFYNSF
jgi:hypothetical protein